MIKPRRAVAADPKTILISGGKMTKALALARSFHRAGHRVILVEARKYRLTGHRFSRAVDRFYTVPEPTHPGYAAALVEIVRREARRRLRARSAARVASQYDARRQGGAAALRGRARRPGDGRGNSTTSTRSPSPRPRSACPCPTTHRITDPQQVIDFDFGGRRARTSSRASPTTRSAGWT